MAFKTLILTNLAKSIQKYYHSKLYGALFYSLTFYRFKVIKKNLIPKLFFYNVEVNI